MSTYRLLLCMAGFQCASCLRYLATGLEARFVHAPAFGILGLGLMEHNMVMCRSEALRIPQCSVATRIDVIFSAPWACFVGKNIGWAPPFGVVRRHGGRKIPTVTFAHLLPEPPTSLEAGLDFRIRWARFRLCFPEDCHEVFAY